MISNRTTNTDWPSKLSNTSLQPYNQSQSKTSFFLSFPFPVLFLFNLWDKTHTSSLFPFKVVRPSFEHGVALRAVLILRKRGHEKHKIMETSFKHKWGTVSQELSATGCGIYLHIFHTWCFQICSQLLLSRHNRRTHSANPWEAPRTNASYYSDRGLYMLKD